VRSLSPAAPDATAFVLYENGDLGYARTSNGAQVVMRAPLIGFDDAGDLTWSNEPVRLASVPALAGSPVYRGAFSGLSGPRFPVTSSGSVVFFDASVVGNEGFHLGAAALRGKDWLWRSSPTGPLDGRGSFQTKAVDGSIHYGGNLVWSQGRHVIYGFHGEFYRDMQTQKVGQANQFMDYSDDGLFLGQFGVSSTREGGAGMSGNAFSPTLVLSGGRLFLYHNDESTQGGVHRWSLDGWDNVRELKGAGGSGSAIVLR
jgi:hypothetical protein